MKCPGCASEMATQVVLDIEIDACGQCGGIVLDKGEPEEIERLGVAGIVEGASAIQAGGTIVQTRATAAHCHTCNREMIALTGAGDVEYDWCDGCERLFFDRGELSALEAFQSE
ncbi:MAG: zf-TFIIB domain-containing protein [Proteobacteria bacterium]|nr:zf-TFIIB domain-containing protein [Pseudomonadota bacterium]